MSELWFNVTGWQWAMVGTPSLDDAIKMVERGVVVSKTLGNWDPKGHGELTLLEFLEGARKRTRAERRDYAGAAWHTSSSGGMAQITLGSSAFYVEAWATAKLDDGDDDRLRIAVIMSLGRMCELLAERNIAAFPRYLDAVFGEFVKVRPA